MRSTEAFYGSSDVVTLDTTNFKKLVTKSDDVWFVEFYGIDIRFCFIFFEHLGVGTVKVLNLNTKRQPQR